MLIRRGSNLDLTADSKYRGIKIMSVKILSYLLGLFVLIFSLHVFSQVNDRQNLLVKHMLLHGNESEVKVAAKILFHSEVVESDALDIAASLINKESDSRLSIDTISWIIKALGQSGNGKYLPYLQVENIVNSKNEKVERFLQSAQKRLNKKTLVSEPFSPLNDQALLALAVDSNSLYEERVAKDASDNDLVNEGTSLPDLLDRLGMPAERELDMRSHKIMGGRVPLSSLLLFYPGHATYKIDLVDDRYQVEDVYVFLNYPDSAKNDDNAEVMNLLARGNPLYFLDIATHVRRQRLYFTETMDLIAKRILTDMSKLEKDPLRGPGLEHLIVALGDTGSPRYLDIYESIKVHSDANNGIKRRTRSAEKRVLGLDIPILPAGEFR